MKSYNMNKLILVALAALPVLIGGCNSDDSDIRAVVPTTEGTVTDDMGNTYNWVRIGNLDWTTSNAHNGPSFTLATYEGNWGPEEVFPSYDYEIVIDLETNYMPTYGNLMCYNDAKNSAPEGWRLPTDEDWKNLEKQFGMTDYDNFGWRGKGIVPLLTEQNAGAKLGLQYGGALLRHQSYGSLLLSYMNFKECGYFWTSTQSDNETEPMAYFRKIMYGVDAIERQAATTEAYMSVRWVRDAK